MRLIVSWIRRYPLWYLGALMANIVALVLVLPYRLFCTYVLRKDVSDQMNAIAFVLFQFTEPMYRPRLEK